MSDLHADALACLVGWPAPTDGQERLRTAYVQHLRAHPDAMFRTCYPDHLTASALVLSADRRRVLLTLHRKADAWFQLGGHLEPGDHELAAGALREAREESGVQDLALDPVPLQLDRHQVPFCDSRGGVHHLDVRFLVTAPDTAVPTISEESIDVRWWPVDDLPTEERSIHDLVALGLTR